MRHYPLGVTTSRNEVTTHGNFSDNSREWVGASEADSETNFATRTRHKLKYHNSYTETTTQAKIAQNSIENRQITATPITHPLWIGNIRSISSLFGLETPRL